MSHEIILQGDTVHGSRSGPIENEGPEGTWFLRALFGLL